MFFLLFVVSAPLIRPENMKLTKGSKSNGPMAWNLKNQVIGWGTTLKKKMGIGIFFLDGKEKWIWNAQACESPPPNLFPHNY